MFFEKVKSLLFRLIVFLGIFCFFPLSLKAASIRLEIFCDGQLQPLDAQEWGRALNSAGFQGVQIRGGDGSDVLDIYELGPDTYRVSGMLMKNSQILLPGNARFSVGRVREMKSYLEEQILLMRETQTSEIGSGSSIENGLTKESESISGDRSDREFLFQDLAEPVGFRTQGVSRKKVLQKLSKNFRAEIRFPKSIRNMFDESDLVTEELEDVARGTALVYVLRYLGYCVIPERAETGGYFLKVVSAAKSDPDKILSVGYSVEDPSISKLHERFQANVDGVSASVILESLQKRLEIPFLFDFNSMAGLRIELEKVIIQQKPAKISYRQLLDAVLYQARMKREVRMDEAGKVFFWMTTIRKAE